MEGTGICRLKARDDIGREPADIENIMKSGEPHTDNELQYIAETPNVEGRKSLVRIEHDVLAKIEIDPAKFYGPLFNQDMVVADISVAEIVVVQNLNCLQAADQFL